MTISRRNAYAVVLAATALVLASACSPASDVAPDPRVGSEQQALGYPAAEWNPADPSNFTPGNRDAGDIDLVVIHTAQGYYLGTIAWFQDPISNVSTQYVVGSEEGEITQMVDDSDYAWHVECFGAESIGIEHEGFVDDPGTWYTTAMYTQSAKLVAWLCNQYGIPKDRDHIIGHIEIGCTDHTDPGAGWNWTSYMALVHEYGALEYGATAGAASHPSEMTVGDEAFVSFEFQNDGNFTWTLAGTRLGTQDPEDRESPFYIEGRWGSPSRPSQPDGDSYYPGTTGSFSFRIRAPEVEESTTFTETFQLNHEGVWFGPKRTMTITVHPQECDGPEDCADDEVCRNQQCVPADTPAEGELGAPCTGNEECKSGSCGSAGNESLCTQPCSDAEPCPNDFDCLPGGACWPSEPPEDDPEGGGGCSAPTAPGTGVLFALAAVAFGFTLRRRRRRR